MEISFLIVAVACIYTVIFRTAQRRKMGTILVDKVTGGLNYQYFKLYFEKMGQGERQERSFVSFDIDKFKTINLLYGVQTGDEILRSVYRVFWEILPGEQVYRYHGDVFVGVLRGTDKEEVKEKLERFKNGIQKEIDVKKLPEFTLTFGVCPMDGSRDISVIYTNAALARQAAKESITDKVKFYGEVAQKHLSCRNMEMNFKGALRDGQFQVWYQPKIDMRTGDISGAEALVRWKTEEGTFISPAEFIPVFESTGQIMELDAEVLRNVCEDIGRARERAIDMGPVSVNLSKIHIMKGNIVEQIREFTKEYRIKPSDLSFEFTESAAESYAGRELESFVDRIRQMGYQADMDDYGTGSSTLKSLAHTHFDTLKLDRSFVGMIGDERMDIILKSTINMARRLNMVIVAEGVETEEQAEFLTENGCFIAQGYYYFRPMPVSEYLEILQERTARSKADERGGAL